MTVGTNIMKTPKKITGYHVLFAMLAFFAVIIAVNGSFVFLALDSWTGLSAENSYKRGVSYNRVLERAAAQKALGWTVTSKVTPLANNSADVEFSVLKDQGAVTGLEVEAWFRHPVQEGFDRKIALTEQNGGTYSGQIDLPSSGNWRLRITTHSADGTRYRLDKDLWLKE